MKVYKFGGASVKDAAGIRNLAEILQRDDNELVVVISAMGKTTNALEQVVAALYAHRTDEASNLLDEICTQHVAIARELGLNDQCVRRILPDSKVSEYMHFAEYDELYDQVVSLGELMSTSIVTAYLQANGLDAAWYDMTHILLTDTRFREAQPDLDISANNLKSALAASTHRIVILQGFIGGTADGRRTTLGREGSDYTAALVANFLDAESVTIWKDVPGILNADPRRVEHTTLIPELSYLEAVELAYSGAQVIHPKTIRPLENKRIPLYVKPFAQPQAGGSIIHDTDKKIDVPVYIWRDHQTLITMRAKDFGFVLEESLSQIFEIIHRNRLKVSMIQSSAVTISVTVDATRYVPTALNELAKDYRVTYNEGLALLTIRGTTPEILAREQQGRTILLSQKTRRTVRLLVKE